MQPVAMPLFTLRLSKTRLPVQVSLGNSHALMLGTELHPAKLFSSAPASRRAAKYFITEK